MVTPAAKYRRLAIAVRYRSVLFPFDVFNFLRAVSKLGFILPPESIEPAPLGTRLEVTGTVARKGEVAVRLNTERQILQVEAQNPNAAVTEMASIESLLRDEFELDSSQLAEYYEFLASLNMRAKKNPLASWSAHFAELAIVQRFSEMVGREVCPFGVRLADKGGIPTQTDWFELRIEPLVQAPTTHHLVEVVFRRARGDEVLAFVRKFEDTLPALLGLVEQE
jgi:hypothetical protein